jgi:sec-independent protein translocase protein TatB
MIGMGIFELLLIFVVALVVVGPDKMPETARKLAKLLREFGRVKELMRSSMLDIEEEAGLRDLKREAQKEVHVLKDMHPEHIAAKAIEGAISRDSGIAQGTEAASATASSTTNQAHPERLGEHNNG